eukprot:CAMPEP_0201622938 /NCGR_PEP_ID=MMETSP0492-20130828/47662_2 /ASSEMBLY_ACC=CAM_ASM_000837 /TAXON_ID=420259 /ORGANISM="Thalassiosira gravida, Strain GMp14c1" /LENGTH=172 /DNA_ID=CAMNT_0048092539 /DNA_START=219 /DNA_END=737 /DNA_ORIENTATION=-
MVKWMFESHLVAAQVKSLVSQGFGKSSSIVGFIPEERASSHPSHVSTQLMISPRFGFQLHQTHRVVPRVFQRPSPQGSPDRDRRLFLQCMLYQLPGCRFSFVADADSEFFGFIGGDGCFFWLLDVAVDNGSIWVLKKKEYFLSGLHESAEYHKKKHTGESNCNVCTLESRVQ